MRRSSTSTGSRRKSACARRCWCPILPDQYGRVLEAGGIRVTRAGATFQVECAEHVLPLAPNTLPAILTRAAEYAGSDTLSFLAASFGRLPAPEYIDRETILARHRDKVVLFRLLERMSAEEPGVCEPDRSRGCGAECGPWTRWTIC